MDDDTTLPEVASPGQFSSLSAASYPSYGDESFDMSQSETLSELHGDSPAGISILTSDHSAGACVRTACGICYLGVGSKARG